MAEYIEREALIKEIRKAFALEWEVPCSSKDRIIQEAVSKVYDLIRKQPTADVVEVVRCKDCKHFIAGVCIFNMGMNFCIKDDFCSYGEKRGDGNEQSI